MKALVVLVVVMLFAGCTQLDDAKKSAADAQAKLDEAKREAQEAKDRYDRVKSAIIVRQEALRVIVVPMSDAGEMWFDAGAWRGDLLVDPENVTSMPHVRVRFADANVTCDPLTCRLANPGVDVNVTWADGSEGYVLMERGNVACQADEPESSYCRIGELTRERVLVNVTTALGDVTA